MLIASFCLCLQVDRKSNRESNHELESPTNSTLQIQKQNLKREQIVKQMESNDLREQLAEKLNRR